MLELGSLLSGELRIVEQFDDLVDEFALSGRKFLRRTPAQAISYVRLYHDAGAPNSSTRTQSKRARTSICRNFKSWIPTAAGTAHPEDQRKKRERSVLQAFEATVASTYVCPTDSRGNVPSRKSLLPRKATSERSRDV